MGKFDKKVSKKEADAPKSLKIKKKQSTPELARYDTNKAAEKDRNLKILNFIHRSQEVKMGGGSKADAHLDVEKMVKRQKRKEEKARKKQK
mmetsp:Transcript_20781/g.15286  ORF Transcript_20781/g.15286 Transcript_20781/m.15286 type:complete len:91 (+) Transcript_20781:670-942(+)